MPLLIFFGLEVVLAFLFVATRGKNVERKRFYIINSLISLALIFWPLLVILLSQSLDESWAFYVLFHWMFIIPAVIFSFVVYEIIRFRRDKTFDTAHPSVSLANRAFLITIIANVLITAGLALHYFSKPLDAYGYGYGQDITFQLLFYNAFVIIGYMIYRRLVKNGNRAAGILTAILFIALIGLSLMSVGLVMDSFHF